MTALTFVTQKEMKKRTGLSTALGYTFPEEDEILIRKGLDPELKKKVLAHEEEHMEKGEEGPFWNLLIPAAASIIGGVIGSKGAKSAASTAAAGSERELEFARESRDLARGDQAPYREAGNTALSALMSLTGLGGPQGGSGAVNYGNPMQHMGAIGTGMGRGINDAVGRYGTRVDEKRFGSAYGARYAGGPIGNDYYNINELGPENVYQGGAMSRNPNPMTIAPSGNGYVQPNIQGRAYGGQIGNFGGYSPPQMGVRDPRQDISGGNQAGSTAINPQTGYPNENPGGVEGGYQFQTDPGYQFRFEEGQRALDRGAAQKGGLLSGGYARKAMRYGQGFASNEFSNVYNRISNIAGLGQVSAGQSGNAAMQGGYQMGTAASQSAYAQAAGQQAGGNAWANAGNAIASQDWGSIFKKKPTVNTWDPYRDNMSRSP